MRGLLLDLSAFLIFFAGIPTGRRNNLNRGNSIQSVIASTTESLLYGGGGGWNTANPAVPDLASYLLLLHGSNKKVKPGVPSISLATASF